MFPQKKTYLRSMIVIYIFEGNVNNLHTNKTLRVTIVGHTRVRTIHQSFNETRTNNWTRGGDEYSEYLGMMTMISAMMID